MGHEEHQREDQWFIEHKPLRQLTFAECKGIKAYLRRAGVRLYVRHLSSAECWVEARKGPMLAHFNGALHDCMSMPGFLFVDDDGHVYVGPRTRPSILGRAPDMPLLDKLEEDIRRANQAHDRARRRERAATADDQEPLPDPVDDATIPPEKFTDALKRALEKDGFNVSTEDVEHWPDGTQAVYNEHGELVRVIGRR